MASSFPVQGFRFNRSITSSGTGDANSLIFAPGRSHGGGIQISGTFSGTVVFEQSIDNGTTWIAKNVFPTTGVAPVTSATAAGQFQFRAGGEVYVRVRCSVFASGTIVVDAILTAGEPDVVPIIARTSMGGATWTKTVFSLTGASDTVLSANTSRKGILISNPTNGSQIDIDPSGGTVVANGGISLGATQFWSVTGDLTPTVAIKVIGTGAKTCVVYELT